MKTMYSRLMAAGSMAVVAITGLAPAKAQSSAQNSEQGSAIALPPPIAPIPAQPLAPPPVITPATPPPPPDAATAPPAYRLVSPQFTPPDGVAAGAGAEPRWNSGGGGAVPILEPASPPENPEKQPHSDAAAVPSSTLPPAPNSPPAVTQTPPDPWLPRQNAVLGVLNKEDGSVSRLAVQVGNSVVQGKLKITILACVSRPDTLAPDAAVFLSVKNIEQNHNDNSSQAIGPATSAQIFKGWLLRSEPGASVVGDATDMFSLVDCGTF